MAGTAFHSTAGQQAASVVPRQHQFGTVLQQQKGNENQRGKGSEVMEC
ncbi:hypothetical protein ACFFIZ_02415 [Paracoccus rhizosphaerae]|uniref:Uncharacterized protein n=2 Tax=Paracoccus rhizosphaerae TaxID=1133347 RepID=A0ABV6CER3_9RHOB